MPRVRDNLENDPARGAIASGVRRGPRCGEAESYASARPRPRLASVAWTERIILSALGIFLDRPNRAA